MAKQKVTMPLPTRPEPPSLQEMTEDIEKAEDGDIVFNFYGVYQNTADTPLFSQTGIMSDSYEEQSPRKSPIAMATNDEADSDQTAAIDTCYEKAKRYIEMNEYLAKSNEKLSRQYEELQNTGQHLTQSIEQLRTQTAQIKH
ncbi:uncharacterized protein LOC100370103 [Saccoglossus kowalevskii]|uniref:Uncharacterized protein LOC100370103 n=1 Tax=Saccoglossus kowalevskii TaxID=10224 RepID=A0ABM0GNI6_SACKO|nr:PREDICTED: uncharacterized protein LOC100370103 [Saccoglossus kowalevskii]